MDEMHILATGLISFALVFALQLGCMAYYERPYTNLRKGRMVLFCLLIATLLIRAYDVIVHLKLISAYTIGFTFTALLLIVLLEWIRFTEEAHAR